MRWRKLPSGLWGVSICIGEPILATVYRGQNGLWYWGSNRYLEQVNGDRIQLRKETEIVMGGPRDTEEEAKSEAEGHVQYLVETWRNLQKKRKENRI